MPFVSKAQWRQCFVDVNKGKRNKENCLKFARLSKPYILLPEKVGGRRGKYYIVLIK